MGHNIYVTGFAKTLNVHTKAEIHYIAQDDSYTQELSIIHAQCLYCPV